MWALPHDSVGGIAIACAESWFASVFVEMGTLYCKNGKPKKGMAVSPAAHEKAWVKETGSTSRVGSPAEDLEQYANALAVIAGVED